VPSNIHTDVGQKVKAIFAELAGDRVQQLDGAVIAATAQNSIAAALLDDCPAATAHDVAFHLTDWNCDAAFLVALLLYPERFTKEEVNAGIQDFLTHAPNHVAAAAKLAGWPVRDIFNVGALSGPNE
jgi:hypothetical protein